MKSFNIPRKPIVTLICIVVAALHFFTGPTYSGPARFFVTGYLIDLLLPFSSVLLLGVDPRVKDLLRSPVHRAFLVLLLGAFVELAQFLGFHLFGRTFDPLDLAMYAVGVAAAVGFERIVFLQHVCGGRV